MCSRPFGNSFETTLTKVQVFVQVGLMQSFRIISIWILHVGRFLVKKNPSLLSYFSTVHSPYVNIQTFDLRPWRECMFFFNRHQTVLGITFSWGISSLLNNLLSFICIWKFCSFVVFEFWILYSIVVFEKLCSFDAFEHCIHLYKIFFLVKYLRQEDFDTTGFPIMLQSLLDLNKVNSCLFW